MEPCQHMMTYECIGHDTMALPEITPAHLGVRMRCSSRYGCRRSRQHTMTLESITISDVRERDSVPLDAAQRLGIQLPRARCTRRLQKRHDLAREAVNCNAVLLECSCSQRSGALNGGRGACYPVRDARWERLRGRGTQRVPGASQRS